MVVKKILV